MDEFFIIYCKEIDNIIGISSWDLYQAQKWLVSILETLLSVNSNFGKWQYFNDSCDEFICRIDELVCIVLVGYDGRFICWNEILQDVSSICWWLRRLARLFSHFLFQNKGSERGVFFFNNLVFDGEGEVVSKWNKMI